MGFEPITITGKPRLAAEALVGFPYELPLDREPPQAWQRYFAGFDWQKATGLKPNYCPKLVAGSVIALPSVQGEEAWRKVLATIDVALGEINRMVAEEEVEREKAEKRQQQSTQQKRAEDEQIFDRLWAERQSKS